MQDGYTQVPQTSADGRTTAGMLFAIFIVAAGAILLLDNLGIFYAGDLWRYWPVALVAIGMLKLLDSAAPVGRLWGGLLVAAGGLLLAGNFGYLPVSGRILWPLLLIGVGLTMLLVTLEGQREGRNPGASSPAALNEWTIFGGGKRRVTTPDFEGGEVFVVFGGYEIDLRGAGMQAGQAVVNITAIFGGIEIRVPESWSVVLQGTPIFGGVEDKSEQPNLPDAKRLIIKGLAAFGGIEIKN